MELKKYRMAIKYKMWNIEKYVYPNVYMKYT